MRDKGIEHEAYQDDDRHPISTVMAWVLLAACVGIVLALVAGAAWWRA